MPMRTALMKSKNMVSIRILQSIGTRYAQDWITNFGFDRQAPAYLTMALGAGSVTPMQMAVGYSVFANGGYRVNPLVTRITDHKDKVLVDKQPSLLNEANARHSPAQRLHHGHAAERGGARRHRRIKAQAMLKRPDLYGKTGTTNDSLDAWFAGFQPTSVAISGSATTRRATWATARPAAA
jgi:penicillin-binding protein 1A